MTIGTKSRFLEWKKNVERWRAKYETPPEYNPSKVRLLSPTCQKCGTKWNLTRHHKGNEYLFATLDEEGYAARYIQFHPGDVVVLCERCHEKIHHLYQWILEQLYGYLAVALKPERKVLEKFRKRFVRKCDEWLKRKMKKPSTRVKARYRR